MEKSRFIPITKGFWVAENSVLIINKIENINCRSISTFVINTLKSSMVITLLYSKALFESPVKGGKGI